MLQFNENNASRVRVTECCDFGFSASVGSRSSSVAHSSFALGVLAAQAMTTLRLKPLHLPLHLPSLKFLCGIFSFILRPSRWRGATRLSGRTTTWSPILQLRLR